MADVDNKPKRRRTDANRRAEARYRERNRAKIAKAINARRVARWATEPEVVREERRDYVRRNREKIRKYELERSRRQRAENPELAAVAARAAYRRRTPEQRLRYMAKNLIARFTGLPAVLIPDDLVVAKMAQLRLGQALRDSDGNPKGGDSATGSVRSMTARPEGIARNG